MNSLSFLERANVQIYLQYDNNIVQCFGFVSNLPTGLLNLYDIPINVSITHIDHKQIKGFFYTVK
jgi:hypothetical protein